MPAKRGDYGPALFTRPNGSRDLLYTSVSALAKFDHEQYGGCQRRWYLRYVERVPEPQTAVQIVGTQVHEQIEHYLTSGQDVLGKVARAGKHLLPEPGPDLIVEQPLQLVNADGVKLVGSIDWVNPRGTYVTPEGEVKEDPPGTIECGDNKTTSNLSYAKKGEELILTTQMPGYGEDLRLRFPNAEFIRLSHVSFQTRGARGAVKTTALFPVETVKKRWYESGHSVARDMRGVAQAQSWEEVPMNEASCCSFNKPCAYSRSHCFKDNAVQRLRQSLRQPTTQGENMASSLMDKVLGKKSSSTPPELNGKSKGINLQDESTTPDVPVTPKTDGLTASKAEQGKAYKLPSGMVGMFLCATSGKFSFINPKGGVPVLLDSNDPISGPVPLNGDEVAAPAPAAAASASPAAPWPKPPSPGGNAPAPAAEEEKKTVGRPKGSTNKKKEEEIVTQTVAEISLFINCVPAVKFLRLETYIAGLVTKLEEQYSVPDLRLPTDKNSPLAYGGYKGALAGEVKATPPEPGVYVAFTRGNELTEIAVEALVPLCGNNVVRGI